MYERAALILDSESHALGGLSLSLIALGLRPIYADEMDELVLLSREYRRHVGAVLVAADELAPCLPTLRKQVLEPLSLPVCAVVPVGERPAAETAEALRGEGLRLWLPTPHETHELRFVVAHALSHNDPTELRMEPRVPCSLPVEVESQHRTVMGSLEDVSTIGAFVALEYPPGEQLPVTLRFRLDEQDCTVAARVSWRTGTSAPAWRNRGMGVEFVSMDAAVRTRLRDFTTAQIERFRL